MTSVAASSSPTWRGGRRLWQSVVLAVALLTGALAAPAGAQGGAPRTVRVWEIPHDTPLYPGTQLSTGAPGLARGPDGNIWFSQIFPNEGQFPSRVGRISPNGVFQRPYSTGNDLVEFMTPGPDGNVWFAEHFGAAGGASVGRITSSGRLTRFPTCGLPSCSLGDLAVGADGNLWVPSGNGLIYRVTPGGQVTGFPVPLPAARPIAITAGPDGNMWFTDSGRDEIGRITPDGVVTEFPLIHPKGIPVPHGVLQLLHITSFAGDLWVDAGSPGYGFNGSIGRIDTHGRLVATGTCLAGSTTSNMWSCKKVDLPA